MMEAILTLVAFGVAWILFWAFVGYVGRVMKSTAAAATGKGSFKDNFDLEMNGMGPLKLRGVPKEIGEAGERMKVLELEVKGLFPVAQAIDGVFVTSLFDKTDGDKKWRHIISIVHQCQEEETFSFQCRTDVGVLEPNYGFKTWVRVGFLLPAFLQAPRRGTRNLCAYVRLIDRDDPPPITNGFGDNSKVIWAGLYEFNQDFDDPGYLDEMEGSREAAKASVKLAIAVALADGSLHEQEALVVKGWIQKKLAGIDESSRESWKSELNLAFKEGFAQASAGTLSYSELTKVLAEKGSIANNTECVDLLFEIVGADGEVNSGELALAKKIAGALNVDPEEIQRIADRSTISVDAKVSSSSDLEDLLGIELSWTNDAIKKHLREQFQKWNNRLTSLSDPGERDKAQRMLTLISEARNKYQ